MSARKKKVQINLLPKTSFSGTTTGRILSWVLSTFRIIVIVTEIIVMIAFLSRFWLDAQNTDLNEEIKQKQAVIAASSDFQNEFIGIQKRLVIYKKASEQEGVASTIIKSVSTTLPANLILSSLRIEEGKVIISGITTSERSIQQFIVNLANKDDFETVGLVTAETKEDQPGLLTFRVSAEISSEGESK